MMHIIGLTCGLNQDTFELRKFYQQAFLDYDVAVVLLPVQPMESIPRLCDLCSGLIFTGGGDIHPCFWQQEPNSGQGNTDITRDNFELALADRAIKSGKPILGICRGMQVINVAMGGSLWQDIKQIDTPIKIEHSQKAAPNQLWHQVETCDNQMTDFLGSHSFYVNSLHHQGIDQIGQNLKVGVKSKDGVIEGIYNFTDNFILGVQWHPERLWDYHDPSLNIFAKFYQVLGNKKVIMQEK